MNSSTNATKRWWYIMPIVFITYSLAYLDRANFSFASAAGITEDTGITKGISSLLGALFFLGYFFFQIPGAIYAERRSVRKLIFICLILWGGCASLTGIVHNIPALAAIRFILGVVEAAVMPAMLIYISNWFTKSERSRANTFLILGNPVTGPVDVGSLRLPDSGLRLAGNVHHRRGAGGDLGLLLVGAGER